MGQDNDSKIDLKEFQKYIYSSRTSLLDEPHSVPTKSSLVPTNSNASRASGQISAAYPVLLGNQKSSFAANVGATKGPQQGPRFADGAGALEVHVAETYDKKLPPACCVVQ